VNKQPWPQLARSIGALFYKEIKGGKDTLKLKFEIFEKLEGS